MSVPTKSKINVVTLGCSKNQVDSEVLLGQLRLSNARLVRSVDEADTVVINTCGFIEAAQRESIDAILEAVDRKNEGKLRRVLVMGCLAQRFRTELSAEIPEVDAYFGSDQLSDVLGELGADFRRELLGERVLSTPAHFAYLKISEGCDHPCSFCAIPLMRGAHRSVPEEEVLTEARLLASRGVKELILIGQDTTYYGLDLCGERKLGELMQKLSHIDGIEWIRLMYAYPAKFPSDIVTAFQSSSNICRYLDVPVQHSSDAVLRSMRRGMTGRAVRELLGRLRNEVPGIALRTTLIVGYPTETDEDFENLCDFVKEIRFDRLGVFTYSQEDGTGAYPLGDPISPAVKQERRSVIMEIQKEISEQLNRGLVGTNARVLIDREDGDYLVGRTERDAPEIDQEVYLPRTGGASVGEFCNVCITDAREYDLQATIVSNGSGTGREIT